MISSSCMSCFIYMLNMKVEPLPVPPDSKQIEPLQALTILSEMVRPSPMPSSPCSAVLIFLPSWLKTEFRISEEIPTPESMTCTTML